MIDLTCLCTVGGNTHPGTGRTYKRHTVPSLNSNLRPLHSATKVLFSGSCVTVTVTHEPFGVVLHKFVSNPNQLGVGEKMNVYVWL